MDLDTTVELLSSEKKCPFSNIAGHETTTEMQTGRNMLSLHIAVISIVLKLNQDTNTKEMLTCFKQLLRGKCQRQNSSEIMAFWRSLQASVKALPKPKLEDLFFSFLGNILCEGMKHDGALSIFKITDIFFETCKSFIASSENEDAVDKAKNENINLKKERNKNKNQVSVFHLNSLCDGSMTEASNAASNNNSLCCKGPLSTINPQSSDAEPELRHSGECKKVDEDSNPSQQQSCKATVERATSEVGRIVDKLISQGFTSNEECTTEETVQACAVMPRKEKKTEERAEDKRPNKGSDSEYAVEEINIQACTVIPSKGKQAGRGENPNKASAFTEEWPIMAESIHACQGIPNIGKKTKETGQDKKPKKVPALSRNCFCSDGLMTEASNVARNNILPFCKERSSTVNQKNLNEDTEVRNLESKQVDEVSLPSGAGATSFTDEFQVPGEPNCIKTQKQKNGSLSAKKKLPEREKTSHEESAKKRRAPQNESKAVQSSKKEVPVPPIREKTMQCQCQQKSPKENKVMTEGAHASHGKELSLREEIETLRSRENKVSETPEKKTYPVKEEADSQASAISSEKEAMLSELSVPIQAPRNPAPPPILSKPVQEELTELKNEICCLRAELFKTRKKFDEAQDDNWKQIRYHKEMNEKLVEQIQHYVSQLKKFEKLYYSRTNSTL